MKWGPLPSSHPSQSVPTLAPLFCPSPRVLPVLCVRLLRFYLCCCSIVFFTLTFPKVPRNENPNCERETERCICLRSPCPPPSGPAAQLTKKGQPRNQKKKACPRQIALLASSAPCLMIPTLLWPDVSYLLPGLRVPLCCAVRACGSPCPDTYCN